MFFMLANNQKINYFSKKNSNDTHYKTQKGKTKNFLNKGTVLY